MTSWFGAQLAHCKCHSYLLIEEALFEDGFLITVLLCLLVIHSHHHHHHHWQAQSYLCSAYPEASQRNKEQFAEVLYGKRDEQEGERNKAWPGTFEVMGSEREERGWEFNLKLQASRGCSWVVRVNNAGSLQPGLLLSPVQCTLQW